MYLKHVYTIENCECCREWFCAQAYVKVDVGALCRGIRKTKQTANKQVVYYSEGNCVVDRRE